LTGNHIPLKERNIVLTGFMGVGKTTVGQLIADRLYRDFIDVDQEIERRHGMTIPEIFKRFGEPKFREMERECIADLCNNTRLKVISLGGGAFMQEEVRKVCLATSIVFFLDLSWDSWKDRIHLIMDNRPVLQQKSLEEIEQLFIARQKAYSINHSTVPTDQLNPSEVADHIISTLKLGYEIYEPSYWK